LDFTLNNRQNRQPSYAAAAPRGEGVFETLNGVAGLVLQNFIRVHSGQASAKEEMILT
jgi:hypothetical protein